jgi:hypothetical protein
LFKEDSVAFFTASLLEAFSEASLSVAFSAAFSDTELPVDISGSSFAY